MYMFKYPLQSLYFSDRSENQDGRPAAGLWLTETFSTSPSETAEQNSTKFERKQDLNVFYQFYVFLADRKKKTRWTPRPLIGWGIFDFSSETENGIWPKLTGSKISTFVTDRKTKMTAQHLIGWDIFDFTSETAARNSTKNHWKQDLNVFYQVRVFGRSEKQPPQPLMGETFSNTTSPMKQLNKIQRNMTVSKISTSSTKFVG